MSYYDVNEKVRRQYIESCQKREALLQAVALKHKFRGSMYWMTAKGHEYLVLKRDGLPPKRVDTGKRSPETEAIQAKFKAGRRDADQRFHEINQSYVETEKLNVVFRVGRVPNVVVGILERLRRAGLQDKLLVIGTNAIFAYETCAGVRFNNAEMLATEDADLLWDSRQKIVLASDPELNEGGLLGLLQSVDRTFMLSDGKSRAINASGYMVDLIKRRPVSLFDDHEAQQLAPNEEDFWAAKITNMDWLLSAPRFRQVVVGTNGAMAEMVTVDPRAFVLFKLWVSQKEDRRPDKKVRDLNQARAVFDLVEDRFPHLSFSNVHWFPERVRKLLDTSIEEVKAVPGEWEKVMAQADGLAHKLHPTDVRQQNTTRRAEALRLGMSPTEYERLLRQDNGPEHGAGGVVGKGR